ncbi:hypothetical protein E2C01_073730 [Portunus trituberculatus]|uniref:Uncharacterized protein n=1 Tax=Portunus trituberculatus TaxID=210409 RepID=A0A5B7IEM5_PORTR|nr:hypothetical protein [Portunus trituberculatus]
MIRITLTEELPHLTAHATLSRLHDEYQGEGRYETTPTSVPGEAWKETCNSHGREGRKGD